MLHLAKDVDKILLMDSSGFNLPLAKKLKKRYPNKEIIYYILPQAWAWKQKRIKILSSTIDHLASILPFEPSYYPKDAPIEYVGHPLLDQITTFKQTLRPNIQHIAFMPGSRKGEIKRLMPIFQELRKHLKVTKASVIIPKYFSQNDIASLYGDLELFEVVHDAHATLYEADFAFICSGTATLEATLIGTPFILAYKAKPLDYFLGSRLVKLTHVGLANIMFMKYKNKEIHPEFLQDEVTVENLLQSYNTYNTQHFLDDAKALREYLAYGSAKNVAKLVMQH
jgi:lipid-A-disaccharide synthase